jgi:hypothetical protein
MREGMKKREGGEKRREGKRGGEKKGERGRGERERERKKELPVFEKDFFLSLDGLGECHLMAVKLEREGRKEGRE